MITRRGVGLTVVAVAVFFLASSTRVGWVHLADAVLWGMILLSFVVSWVTLPGLSVQRETGLGTAHGLSGPLEGEPWPVTIVVCNRWWWPRFLVSVRYEHEWDAGSGTRKYLAPWLGPRAAAKIDDELIVERRGRHRLGDVTVEATGPFGLFRRRRTFPMLHIATVFPRWQHVESLGLLDTTAGETERGARARTGFETTGTRPFAPGDSFRFIHWRNSARTGRLSVREFDSWHSRNVTFAFCASDPGFADDGSSLDYSARIAAGAARALIRDGGSVALVDSEGQSPVYLDWAVLMEKLAVVQPARPSEFGAQLANMAPGSRVLAFVDATDAGTRAALADAAARGVSATEVVFFREDNTEKNARGDNAGASGLVTVTCRPDGLSSVMADLERGETAGAANTERRVRDRAAGEAA